MRQFKTVVDVSLRPQLALDTILNLRIALRRIAAEGGTFSDDILPTATGPNGERAKGRLLLNCREIARKALVNAGGGA